MGKTLGMTSEVSIPADLKFTPPPEIPPGKDINELIYLELRKIRERVAPAKYEVLQIVNGANSLVGDFDTNGIPINSLLINITAGTLKLWLTADGGTTAIEPLTYTAVGVPTQTLIPLKDRHISWTNDAACRGTIFLQAL